MSASSVLLRAHAPTISDLAKASNVDLAECGWSSELVELFGDVPWTSKPYFVSQLVHHATYALPAEAWEALLPQLQLQFDVQVFEDSSKASAQAEVPLTATDLVALQHEAGDIAKHLESSAAALAQWASMVPGTDLDAIVAWFGPEEGSLQIRLPRAPPGDYKLPGDPTSSAAGPPPGLFSAQVYGQGAPLTASPSLSEEESVPIPPAVTHGGADGAGKKVATLAELLLGPPMAAAAADAASSGTPEKAAPAQAAVPRPMEPEVKAATGAPASEGSVATPPGDAAADGTGTQDKKDEGADASREEKAVE